MAKIAVIETGGKQYVVADGSVLTIEKLDGTFTKGDAVSFDKVLLVDDGSKTEVGAPYISGAKVGAEFVEEGRKAKVTTIHFREKSRSRRKQGHRQHFMKVKVTKLP